MRERFFGIIVANVQVTLFPFRTTPRTMAHLHSKVGAPHFVTACQDASLFFNIYSVKTSYDVRIASPGDLSCSRDVFTLAAGIQKVLSH